MTDPRTNERLQPVCKGTNERGELVWGFVPMARWQCVMFPLKYVGDFAAFWYKRFMLAVLDYEMSEDIPNADYKARKFGHGHGRKHHTGD